MRRFIILGAVALAIGAAAGCEETVEPGDYVVYRVAQATESLSDGCYGANGEPANVESDSSSLRARSTIILFATADETYLAELPTMVLDGTFDGETDLGDAYAFAGESVDVEWDDANGTGNKRTTKVETELDLSIDGASLTGELVVTTTYACQGPSCGNVPAKCVSKTEFVGTEVEDAELKHEIGGTGIQGSGSGSTGSGTSTGSSSGGSGAGGGGEGGSGEGGGTTSCSTCNDVFSSGGSVSPVALCTTSEPIYGDLLSCACELCFEVCGDNMCSESTADSDCQSCAASSCSVEAQACVADVGDAESD